MMKIVLPKQVSSIAILICCLLLVVNFPVTLPSRVLAEGLESISVSVSDGLNSAANGTTLNYTIIVTNNSDLEVQAINGRNYLPAYVNFVSSDIPGYTRSGNQVSFLIEELGARQQLRFRMTGRIALPDGVIGGQLTNTIELTKSESTIAASDNTQIAEADNNPDFSLFLNCIVRNTNNTFTAFFGYTNRLSVAQPLTSSFVTPAGIANPPSSLLAGRRDRVFSATTANTNQIVWTASAGSVNASASANYNSSLCEIAAPNVGVGVVSSTQLNVNWNPVAGALRYEVYRNDSLIGSVTTNSFSDSGLTPNTTYTYKVISIGNGINSAPSAPISEKTPDGTSEGTIEQPDFVIFTNCITLNSNETYTVYFGYQNLKSTSLSLDSSYYIPGLMEEPLKVLLPGRIDRAFNVTVSNDTVISWKAIAQQTSRVTTANTNSPKCPGNDTNTDTGGGNLPDSQTGGGTQLRLRENPVATENINFYEGNIITAQECSSRRLKVTGKVDGNVALTTIDYSLDGGNKWLTIPSAQGLATNSISYNILSRSLRDRLYGLQIRVTTASGNKVTSQVIPTLFDCVGVGAIVSHQFQNGFGTGLINRAGELLFNPYQPLKITVETLGGIAGVEIQFAADNFESSSAELPAIINYATGLWEVEIPAELLSNLTSEAQLVASHRGKKITKRINSIVNTSRAEEGSASVSDQNFSYELFFLSANRWTKLDYFREFGVPEVKDANAIFHLYPGQYYFKVTASNRIQYYSQRFSISKASLVKVSTYAASAWPLELVRSFFNELKITTFDADYISNSISNNEKIDFNNYSHLISKARESQNDLSDNDQLILVPWNNWDPYLSEQLPIIAQLVKQLKLNGYTDKKVYLYTDIYSKNSLEKTLKANRIDINYIIVEPALIDYNYLSNSTQSMSVLDLKGKSARQLHGLFNLPELLNSLAGMGYIELITKK